MHMRCLRITIAAVLLLGTLSSTLAAPASRPENLPKPPPLPESLRDKRPEKPPPELPDPSQLIDQLQQLQELLSMPPERLQKLRHTIEFIERMSPSEREAMHIRLSQITRMTDELRDEIRDLANHVPSLPQSDVSQFWLSNSQSEREAFRSHFSKLDNVEKAAFLKEKVDAFVERRDEVFARMRESLEKKRRTLTPPGD